MPCVFQTATRCSSPSPATRSTAQDRLRSLRQSVETFGKQGTLELATIIGDYAMAAIMLNATDQHLPPGREKTLPVK